MESKGVKGGSRREVHTKGGEMVREKMMLGKKEAIQWRDELPA